MLRIHFTADDLVRTRVAETCGAAAEAYFALQLRHDESRFPSAALGRLRTGAAHHGLGPESAPLAALVSTAGPALDLVTLTGRAADIDEAAERLLRVPAGQLRKEIEYLDLAGPRSAWHRRLAAGERGHREQLVRSLRSVHGALVAPHAERVRSHLTTVRSRYADHLLTGGVPALLEHLSPGRATWRPPVLEVEFPRDGDVHLAGRGLVIAPAALIGCAFAVYHDSGDEASAPVLAVPTADSPLLAAALRDGAPGPGRPLEALLGRTRAAALRTVTDGCSTTELAAALGVTPAAASQHTAVLRNAGLITTSRTGLSVRHAISPLGARLLLEGG